MRVCVYVRAFMRVCVYVYICLHVCMYVCMCVCMRVIVHAHAVNKDTQRRCRL